MQRLHHLFVSAFVTVFALLLLAPAQSLHAQQVQAAPGQYDYLLLNLSWGPEFCHNLETLSAAELSDAQRQGASLACSPPRSFALHGLWPQNFNGTWPANCGTRPGLTDVTPYLSITPSIALLQHEWNKHGTCTTLTPKRFFRTAKKAFLAVHVPPQLQHVEQPLQLNPDGILGSFYQANPSWPQGSASLSCAHNNLTAIEVCLSRSTLKPIACQGLHSCGATSIQVAAQPASHS